MIYARQSRREQKAFARTVTITPFAVPLIISLVSSATITRLLLADGGTRHAPTVAAVPASKILALRDALYEADAVTMRRLRDLNMLIDKYEGGKTDAPD